MSIIADIPHIECAVPDGYPALLRRQFGLAYWITRGIMNSPRPAISKLLSVHAGRAQGVDQVSEHARTVAKPSIACKAGCSSCCHQHVRISASEACVIAIFLRVEAPKHPDLDIAAAAVSGLTHMERWARGIACPFLRNRMCSIYAVRPEPCRSHFSVSLGKCLQSWAQRKKSGIVDRIPFVAEPKLVGQMLRAGSDYGLMEAGLQPGFGELAAMVACASRPGNVESWLSSSSVFPEDESTAEYRSRLRLMYEAATTTGDIAAVRKKQATDD